MAFQSGASFSLVFDFFWKDNIFPTSLGANYTFKYRVLAFLSHLDQQGIIWKDTALVNDLAPFERSSFHLEFLDRLGSKHLINISDQLVLLISLI